MLFRLVLVGFFFLFSLPIFFITILVSLLLTERIISPIVHLEDATRRVAEGDFSFRILTRPRDELANLVDSFNGMISELERSRRKLLQAERITAWQEIAQRLAHEIRNPLTPIKLSAQRMLKKHAGGRRGLRQGAASRRHVDHHRGGEPGEDAARVRRVRQAARAQAGGGRSQGDARGGCLRLRAPFFHGCSIDVKEVPESVVLAVDRNQMKRVFANLFTNAIQAMPEGGLLSVRADVVKKAHTSFCRIAVSDTGTGISESDMDSIFDPYFTTKKDGTGLGLAIVQRIVFDHKGNVWAESDGSTRHHVLHRPADRGRGRAAGMSTILIIDDEPGIRTVLRDVLEDEGYTVLAAEDGVQGLAELAATTVDLVFLDVWLPNMGGIDVLKRIREQFPDVEVIMISGHANISLAVQATKMGAFDFLEKPLSLDRTMTVVRNAIAIEDLRRENRTLKNSIFMDDRMVGSSPGMKAVRELIEQAAGSDSRILILGENGTGKELVAREIHARSARAGRPFVELNCAAIPESLIESELFGHEKGAFTSALQRRRGKVEMAHHGTLFLDEIADMSLVTQAKVLRVLQEMRFERVGGEESLSVDVRVISATNKDIREQIRSGRFREDLFFRINVVPITVPPLRERIEDMPELVAYFMEKFKRPSAKEPKTVSPEGMQAPLRLSLAGQHQGIEKLRGED